MIDAPSAADSVAPHSVPPEPLQAAQYVVCLDLDAANLIESISAPTEVLERPLEIGQVFFGTSNTALELTSINVDYSAAGAGKIVIRLEPSDRLACLLAASGARNIDSLII
ncbi:MAG TPA: hypothetical protein VKQ29_14700 [Aliidongia sp.]|nr:hypothetical protein [Aliidongia sp.]